MRRFWPGLVLSLLLGCQSVAAPPSYPAGVPRQSQSLALSVDGATLAVVNPDADSLSIIDVNARTLSRELLLGPRPQVGADGRYEPAIGPRSVDLHPNGQLAYVACQQSGQLVTVSIASGTVIDTLPLGAEPVAVLVHPSGKALYVSIYESGEVVRLPLDDAGHVDASGIVRQPASDRPWGLALDASGATLYATRFLLTPGLDRFDAVTLAPIGSATDGAFADVAPRGNRLLSHGIARGLYGAAVRPSGDGEVWVPHMLLAADVAQPDLDFESTIFPAVSVRGTDAAARTVLTVDSRQPGIDGQFADVVSGPRALAFTPDGSLALVIDMSSEDVLSIDADRKVEVGLLRPLPGHLPEGIVISADGMHAYVDERASNDVAVLAIAAAGTSGARVQVDGPPIARLGGGDPMPTDMRLGQRLFYSANSAEFPLTKNFWIACAGCHLEGRSDAVTWLFLQGPRDTPTNAGGMIGTGFLQRNAVRNAVQQYDEIIRLEMGGNMDVSRPADKMLLDSLANYVNYAIPFARSPEVGPGSGLPTGQRSAAADRGQTVFQRLTCPTCHSGARYTDSGSGNSDLTLSGTVLLHDVGTCNGAGAAHPDQPINADDGTPRLPCEFDTPSLNGVFDTAPYFHDGSAAKLEDVVNRKVQSLHLPTPTATELADLISFLRSL